MARTPSAKKPVQSKRRKIGSARFKLNIEVEFLGLTTTGMEIHGRGVIRDLSMRGARIETNVLVEKDDQLTLFLTLPHQAGLLEIPAVAIRWGMRFNQVGVEFVKLDPQTSRQLMRYLAGVHNAMRTQRGTTFR
jgi:hypothetical protein